MELHDDSEMDDEAMFVTSGDHRERRRDDP
jgi:hypothetical protein